MAAAVHEVNTKMAITEMGAEMEVDRIEMVRAEVVSYFLIGEIFITRIAKVLYCAPISATNSGMQLQSAPTYLLLQVADPKVRQKTPEAPVQLFLLASKSIRC